MVDSRIVDEINEQVEMKSAISVENETTNSGPKEQSEFEEYNLNDYNRRTIDQNSKKSFTILVFYNFGRFKR